MSPCRFLLQRCAQALVLLCASVALAQADDPASPLGGSERPLAVLPHPPGLDPGAMDTSVDPCADFYRYSCGGWEKANPIPPDQASWTVYDKLQEDNQRLLWGLLEEAAAGGAARAPLQQKIGDYYAACMNERRIEAAGTAPLAPLLQRISALHSMREAGGLVASLHLEGVSDVLFSFDSQQDFGDSSRVIAVADAGGLGLPDRAQYIGTGAAEQAIRDAYRRHVARMFELIGEAPPSARREAAAVLSIESALAESTLPREVQRDPRKMYHRMSAGELRRLAPAFGWTAYMRAMGLDGRTQVNVAQPAFMRRLDRLLRDRSIDDWKTYLRWHVIDAQARYLSHTFVQADFDFRSTTLQGVEVLPARWKRCVRWVDRDLGEALGKAFVERTFTAMTRDRVAGMARAIEGAMATRLAHLEWMGGRTRRAALAKLHAMVNKIGYPDRWRDYAALTIRRDDFFGNVRRSLAFDVRRRMAKVGRPVDRGEWTMTAPTVNAYYDAQSNDMNFPAGILQPPLFDPDMDDAPNFGNTGSTIGHELTHGFDDEGRRFDAKGNLRDWWTPHDAAAFERRAACLVDQYSKYTVLDDLKINATLTSGEDIADLGGAVLAYAAWHASNAAPTMTLRDGLTPEQRFFVGMAQWACGTVRPQTLRLWTLTDSHSPNPWRVNGVVSNMPEFARAFACKPGSPMVRARPCRVW